jgi:signal transduction histidine kinase
MLEFLKRLFDLDFYMPHGHCYYWETSLVALHVISDSLIGLAYVSISLTLVYLVRKIRVPFNWVFVAFGLFIGACGGTHFMEVWMVWTPAYWLSGIIKVVTAVASVATGLLLFPLMPKVEALSASAKLAEEGRLNLEAANKELEKLYRKVKELDEMKTQFFANVSHELRTPLTLILGPAKNMLCEDGLTDQQRKRLEVIERNARTLLRHVNDLLDVAKMEAGKMEIHYTKADLAWLVRFTAANFETLAHDREIDLSIDTPQSLHAHIDMEKMERVLLNLISNAFKYTPAGGHIRCSLRAEGERAIITIQDTGPGVPIEMREIIFEPFRQGDGGINRRFGGTGLGLSIAKEFTELHGGTIRVEEAQGGGAVFIIEAPLNAPQNVKVNMASEEQKELPTEIAEQTVEGLRMEYQSMKEDSHKEPEMQKESESEFWTAPNAEQLEIQRSTVPNRKVTEFSPLILVVEDNPDMSLFIRETLATEYRVDSAQNGREGLEKALQLRPDLILSDMMMPQMSGDQMLRELRKNREFDDMPVVLLTAKADDESRVKLLKTGAQDYLMKPFSTEELRARIGNLVTMKRAREILQKELETRSQDIETMTNALTARKRELQMMVEERSWLLDEEQKARKEAEEANRLKDEFLATVSHELRTPLTSILGWARMLRTDKLDDFTLARALETIERNARSQAKLVEDLLDVSRIITGKLRIDARPVGLPGIIHAVVDAVRPAAEAKKIQLKVSLKPDAGIVTGDPNRLQQVIWNLLSNAIKFTPASGSAGIELNRVDSYVEITVSDTGQGIKSEFLPYIFDRFRQADSSITRKHGGLGLGLAIVRHLVELHGGTVEASSPGVGQGATFKVKLPLNNEGKDFKNWENRYITPTNITPIKSSPMLKGLNILIVDDESDTRDLICTILGKCGAMVSAAGSAAEALEIIERWRPDILVSDIGMPGGDGYELIRKIRALTPEKGGSIPAAALTAYAKAEDRERVLSAGFQVHLAKPIEPAELISIVASLAGRNI